MATDSEIKAQKVEMARKANADRNKKRLEMLEQIADGSDEAHAGEMQEQDGDKIVLNENDNKLETKEETTQSTEETQETTAQSEESTTDETRTESETTEQSVEATAENTETTETQEEELPTDERIVNGTRYYLTIVNGKEKWLTKNQLIEKAQKVESADEYLQNASEAVRSTVRTDPSEKDDTVSVEDDDDMEKTLNSAVLGDQEAVKKVASALADLRKQLKEAKQSQPSISQDVVKEIDNRLAFRNAVEWFEGEYSKELSDPNLKRLIYDKDMELAKANPAMPFKERLKKAGDEVRTWINGQKGVQAKPSQEKIERKKTHVNVPAASQRQPVTTEDDEEESVESIIQSMAKGRGQMRAIVHKGRS